MRSISRLGIAGLLVALVSAGCQSPEGAEDAELDEAALSAERQPASLTAAPGRVELGQQITVTWETIATHSTGDRVGLYKSGAADTAPMTWQYVYGAGQTTGTMQFLIPLTSALDPGPYEARYFLAGTWERLAVSNAVEGYAEYALTDVPSSVELGQPVSVTWHAPLAHSTGDRVGLYKVDAVDTAPITWQYVYGANLRSGTLTFTLPITSALDPGPYEFRYFFAGTWVKLATSPSFLGTYEYAVSPASECVFGRALSAAWTAPKAHSTGDRVVLVRAGAPDNTALTWAYVYGAGPPTGTTTMTAVNAGEGSYELRYYFAGTWVLTAVSQPFGCSPP